MPQVSDPFTEHPGDDVLESYALGKIAEPDMGFVEEHLLICGPCRDRLMQADEFIASIRKAAQSAGRKPRARAAGGKHA